MKAALCSLFVDLHKLTGVELAYIAGIIDGEGCISVGKVIPRGNRSLATSNIVLRMSVSNTNMTLLQWFHAKCGGRVNSSKPRSSKHKIQHTWTPASVASACTLLSLCSQFLLIKRRQADLYQELVTLRQLSRKTGAVNPERQLEIVLEIQHLNRRGVCSTPFRV